MDTDKINIVLKVHVRQNSISGIYKNRGFAVFICNNIVGTLLSRGTVKRFCALDQANTWSEVSGAVCYCYFNGALSR